MPQTIDVDLINPFIRSALNALETMAFTKAKLGKPFLKASGEPHCDVSSSIGLSGKATGTVTINFDQDVACKIISRMIGEQETEISATVMDGVGEISNMIAGGAKATMQDRGLDYSIALPTVTVGTGHCHRHPGDVACVVVPVLTDAGDLSIEIAIKTS
jgi:chemotaxis protein CheX